MGSGNAVPVEKSDGALGKDRKTAQRQQGLYLISAKRAGVSWLKCVISPLRQAFSTATATRIFRRVAVESSVSSSASIRKLRQAVRGAEPATRSLRLSADLSQMAPIRGDHTTSPRRARRPQPILSSPNLTPSGNPLLSTRHLFHVPAVLDETIIGPELIVSKKQASGPRRSDPIPKPCCFAIRSREISPHASA